MFDPLGRCTAALDEGYFWEGDRLPAAGLSQVWLALFLQAFNSLVWLEERHESHHCWPFASHGCTFSLHTPDRWAHIERAIWASAACWWLLSSGNQTGTLPLWSEGHLIAFYSDGSARHLCRGLPAVSLCEQTCPLKTLALCQYLQGVSCLCPARHVLGWSGSSSSCFTTDPDLCDGS